MMPFNCFSCESYKIFDFFNYNNLNSIPYHLVNFSLFVHKLAWTISLNQLINHIIVLILFSLSNSNIFCLLINFFQRCHGRLPYLCQVIPSSISLLRLGCAVRRGIITDQFSNFLDSNTSGACCGTLVH